MSIRNDEEMVVNGRLERFGRWERKKRNSSHNFLDRTGMRYGKLVCIRRGPNGTNEAAWVCLCDCGKETYVRSSGLRSGTKSCGCSRATGKGSRPRYKSHVPPGVSARNATIKGYKNSARSKGLEFSLTNEQFDRLTSADCYYCGIGPSRIKKISRNGSWTFNGIDRVDNKRGYVDGNVVPCCSICNHAKATMSLSEFTSWIDRIINFRTQTNT